MAEKENTSYSRGEKWWGSEGVQNPNLTAQPPLLDGAEGELLSPAATVTVEGITASESSDRSTAATPMGGGGHDVAVPSRGSTVGPPGRDEADDLPYGPLTPGAILAGAVTDPPPVLFSGLEPPRLEATGGRVTGADTPKHRIENKRRQRALLASQQPQTQWRVYQGDFDLPDPVAPIGEKCAWRAWLFITPPPTSSKNGRRTGARRKPASHERARKCKPLSRGALTAQLSRMRQLLTSRPRLTKKSAPGRLSLSRGTPSRTTLPPS